MRRLVFLLGLVVALSNGTAWAEESEQPGVKGTEASATTTAAPAKEEELAPWRGSAVNYRNTITSYTLKKDAEQYYNPTYQMSWEIKARWWFNKIFGVGADLNFFTELTNADDTSKRGEVWFFPDLRVAALAKDFVTIPWVGIAIGADLSFILPTSKIAWARSQYLAIRPGLTLTRVFPVLGGLTVQYIGQFTKYLNKYTTASRETPLIPLCGGPDCDRFFNTGVRNPSMRVTQFLQVSQEFVSWLNASVAGGMFIDRLYSLNGELPGVSYEAMSNNDWRYIMYYNLEVEVKPMRSWAIGLGTETLNPQQKLDSTYESPFFNRYTTVYAELRIDIDGLVKQIMGKEE